MDPMTIMALLGGGVNLLSGLFGMSKPPTIDPTAEWLKQYNAANGLDPNNRDLNAAKSSALWSALTGGGNLDPNTWLRQMQQSVDQTQGYRDQSSRIAAAYDPMAGYNAFAAANPYLQGQALSFAQSAMNPFGNDVRTLADAQSAEAMTSVANQLAGSGALGSGAAMAAIGQAAARPKLDALTQISQMQGQLANSTYNNLAPNVLSGFNSGFANRTNFGLNAAQSNLSSLLQQAGLYQSAANPLLALLGQEGASTILAPQFIQNPEYTSPTEFGGMLSSILGGFSKLPVSAGAGPGALSSYSYPYMSSPMAPWTPPAIAGGSDFSFGGIPWAISFPNE